MALLAASCKQTVEAPDNETMNGIVLTEEQQMKAGIKTEKLKVVDIPVYTSVRGVVDVPPSHRASISVFHGGYVRDFDLLPGKEVRKGELLFRLQNPDYIDFQQAYLEVKEQIDFLKTDYERQKTLASESISSEKKYKKAESDYLVAKAKRQSLKEQLELLNINIENLEKGKVVNSISIYSPIAGFVSNLTANQGAYLSPKDVAMEIINTEHMHLELKVYEKDVMKLKEGQKILFKVDESDTTLHGEVHLIEKAIDSKERSVQVHGHIPNSHSQLVVGAYVDAAIVTGINSGYALPVDAVVDMDGLQFVAVKSSKIKDGSLFEKVEVKTGQRFNEMVEILDANKLLDREIVVSGAYDVIN